MEGGRGLECGCGMTLVGWDEGWNNETSSGDDKRQGYLLVCDPTTLAVRAVGGLWLG